MDKLEMYAHNLDEIVDDWPDAGLDEQEAYVAELTQMAAQVAELRGVEATKLLHDITFLRDNIAAEIAPALQQRAIAWWNADDNAGIGPT